jgi:tRNA 2-thiocytidine biosynthesis protein TtcA
MPIIPCNLCGSQENLQRPMIKAMLQSWDKQFPGRLESIFRATTDVVPSHLLDRALHQFGGTKTQQRIDVINVARVD